MTLAVLIVLGLLAAPATAAPAPATQPRPKLHNAASERFGAKLAIQLPKDVTRNADTPVAASFDGDPHTRCVVTGVPYTFTIELPAPLLIDHVAFAQSDYADEAAPEQVEIQFDDAAPVRHALQPTRPTGRRQPAWQKVPADATARTIRVAVRSNHPAKHPWGGIGDIAVLTSADLEKQMAVPGHDPAAAAFVRVPTVAAADPAAAPVALPPVAKPGEHPCLLLTAIETDELRRQLRDTPRGRDALAKLLGVADGKLKGELAFPDPNGPPAQLKDRGDAVAKAHSELSRACGTLGIAYHLTGRREYADRAAEILRGYARRYESYPEHKGANRNDTGKVMAQRLSEAMWLIGLIEGYDYIHDSPALAAADHELIRGKLIRPCITFIWRTDPAAWATARDVEAPGWRTETALSEPRRHASNWLIFYNCATVMAGAVTGDRDMVDMACWNLRRLIYHGVGEDGMWDEGAIGYQFFAMGALVPAMEVAARQGVDLWSFDGRRAKRLFDSPRVFAYPDGTMPGINDSGRNSGAGWQTMVYDYAHLRYADPRYAALINESPRQLAISEGVYVPTRVYEELPAPARVSYPSTVLSGVGYAILRTDSTYALLKYGAHGGVHGHFDKLNLILYGLGDELGGEPRFHRYEDPLHGEWSTRTVAHNTMTVNETSQKAAAGKLLVFEDAPSIKLMRAEVADAYPGAVLDRTVAVVGNTVLDLYRGSSASERTWDRTMRFQGQLRDLPEEAGEGERLGSADGYQHLKVAQRVSADGGWSGAWRTKGGELFVGVAAAPAQEVILARGPDQEHVAVARQRGRTADFGMAYGMGGDAPAAPPRLSADDSVVVLQAEEPPGRRILLAVSHRAGGWQAHGWDSDARVLCVIYQDDQSAELMMCGGTFARRDGVSVQLEDAGNTWSRIPAGKTDD
jgi:hypothetical protein